MLPFINIFGFQIPMYGLLMMIGVVAAILFMLCNRKRYALQKDDTLFFALYCVAFALVGGKIMYIIVELPNLLANPDMWLTVVSGGMVYYGGVIGGIIGGFLYARRYKLNTWKFFDLGAPAVAIGHGIGRIGCFCAGCCYGAPTDSWLGVYFPDSGLNVAPVGVAVLPTQLFEAVAEWILAVVLFLILRKNKVAGKVAGWYLVLYAIVRTGLEFLRDDPRGAFLGVSTSQWISIGMFILGIFLVLGFIQKKKIGDFERNIETVQE